MKEMYEKQVALVDKELVRLKQIMENQPTFDFENVEGIIVGLRCPRYMKGVNVPGYHLHFLTKDRRAGGHVLELTIDKASARIDRTGDFYKLNMEKDTGSDIKAVGSREQ